MSDTAESRGTPQSRFSVTALVVALSGWVPLALSGHVRFINTAVAAAGGVIWTAIVGLTAKIWARVEKTVVDLAGDALDIYIKDLFSRYRRRYFEHLQHRHRNFDVKGLSTQGIYAFEIEQVYVELSIDPRQAKLATSNPIAKALAEGRRRDIWAFLSSPQMDRQNFAILGAPGSGKTTLLKHITLGLAANHGKFRDLKRTPLLLFIRDHAAAIGAKPDQTIAEIAEQAAITMTIPAPPGWFARELNRGRCLVMLDGLDEIADADLRGKVAAWVERQMQAFGKNRFLVSSRPFGYRSNPLSEVSVLEVRSFSSEQSERFINNWYLANETMSAQKSDEGVRIAAREGAADLLKRIRDTPALGELAVNPLLLTMIANVHRYRSSLPGRRVELYAEIFEVFLGKRQQARGMDLDLTPAQKKRVIEPLAFHMMCTEKREISRVEAVEAIGGPLSLVDAKMTAEDFLCRVEESSGLLIERENGVYSFAHLTFQEYLAASHIVERKLQDELANKVAVPWWHEVIRLYVAQSDATRIVEACVADGQTGVAQLTLAVECLEEALAVQPDLRAKVEALVEDGLEDPAPDRARLAAETKLALRLRRMARIDDDHYVDHDFISCAEYQLFIDDRQAVGDPRQPGHWSGTKFSPGSAQEPILGVRSQDAEEFCNWLSDRHGDEWIFRIPSKELGGQSCGNLGYWTSAPDGSGPSGLEGSPGALTRRILWARYLSDYELLKPDGKDEMSIFGSDLIHNFICVLALDFSLRLTPELRALPALYFFRAIDSGPSANRARELDRALDLAHVLARVLARARDRARALDLDRGTVRGLDLILDVDRYLVFTNDIKRARDLDFDHEIVRHIDRDLSRALARAFDTHLDCILEPSIDQVLIALGGALTLNLNLNRRASDQALDRAAFRMLSLHGALTWASAQIYGMPKASKAPWYRRLWHRSSGFLSADAIRILLTAYAGLVLLEERIDGRFPAFEGIRIIKVKKNSSPT